MKPIWTAQLIGLVQKIDERYPDAALAPNAVGNLAITVKGTFVGWLDFEDATINWVDDEPGGAA